jgi:hypothetical protein
VYEYVGSVLYEVNFCYCEQKIYHIPCGRELKEELKHVYEYVGSVLYEVNFCYCEEIILHVWYGGSDC